MRVQFSERVKLNLLPAFSLPCSFLAVFLFTRFTVSVTTFAQLISENKH
jgi:hypothetical protein